MTWWRFEERLAYDAWGKRRPASTWQTPSPGVFIAAVWQRRGFTAHEHIDHVGLIHMGGRVYDPEIGRFLSPDPFVQFPASTQGFNRCAYVGNNPLSYTDPSGYFSLKSLVKTIAIVAVSYYTGNFATSIFKSAVLGGATGGAVGGYLATGTAQGAMLGALSGGVAGGIGGIENIGNLTRGMMHGVTQGAISKAGGGRFGDGALGAFVSSMGSGFVKGLGPGPGQAMMAAAVGGTASVIGGGKFANGAMSGAMVNMFNDQQHSDNRDLRISDTERELAAAGDAEGFWRSRLKAGDPVARSALRSMGIKVNWLDRIPGFDYFFGGSSINNRLQAFSHVYAGGALDVDQARIDLMTAHVGAVDQDTRGVIGLLSPRQIASYHHDVFGTYGLPSTAFGGTPFGGALGSSNTYRLFWCQGCDR